MFVQIPIGRRYVQRIGIGDRHFPPPKPSHKLTLICFWPIVSIKIKLPNAGATSMMRNLYVLAIFALFFSTASYAGDVTKVKGSGALIDLKGEAASPGDLFYTLSSDGKKRGIIQITKVKGDKAIGKIMKGKV